MLVQRRRMCQLPALRSARTNHVRPVNGRPAMSETSPSLEAGAATGGVRILLRLEGVVLFAGMTLLYGLWEGSWWIYAILFLAPDLSFAAYLGGPKVGAIVYNAAHSYLGPVALMTVGLAMAAPLTLSLAMIWQIGRASCRESVDVAG